MTKILVIGDVGGCVTQLTEALPSPAEESDTIVVQVRELIDRGPGRHRRTRIGRAPIDHLAGHLGAAHRQSRGQYVGGEVFWPESLDLDDALRLQVWWMKEQLRVAAAVRTTGGEEQLITHAGLTHAGWQALGEPIADCGPRLIPTSTGPGSTPACRSRSARSVAAPASSPPPKHGTTGAPEWSPLVV